MSLYSEEALRKLNKDDFIGIALSLQSKMESSITKVLEELKLLNDKFDKLQVSLAVTRNANTLLSFHLVDIEKQCWANAQYSRRETLEIVGLPKSFKNDEAETNVCQIFKVLTALSIKMIWMLAIGLRTRSKLL